MGRFDMYQKNERGPVLRAQQNLKSKFSSGGFLHDFNAVSLLPSYETDSFSRASSSGGTVGSPQESLPLRSQNVTIAESAEQSIVVEHLIPGFDVNVGRVRAGASQLSLRREKVSLRNKFVSSRGEGRLNSIRSSGRVEYCSDANPSADIPLASTSGRVDGDFWRERGRGFMSSFLYQPLGVLYTTDNEDGVKKFWELPQGQTLEECISINQNHSVLTGFEKGKQVDERSIRLSTSHKLGVKHLLVTQCATDVKGGTNFNISTSHSFLPDSTLSTSLHTNSSGDCSVEVELQREKKRGNQEVLKSLMVNLRTRDKLLKLQSKSMLKGGAVLMNSLISNLRGQHALRFMATTPLWKTCSVTKSFTTDLRGSQKFCMNALQKIRDHLMVVGSFSTNLKQEECISVEARHEMEGLRNMVLKLSKDIGGSTYLDFTSSLSSQKDLWLWAYRKRSMEGHSMNLEWRHEVSAEHFFSVRASVAKDWICGISAEVSIPC